MSKKLFALTLLTLLMMSVLISVVSAATIFDPVKAMFSGWEAGNLSMNIAKYIFLVLLTLLIFGILKLVPIIKDLGALLCFIVALLVAFLATAYLTPSEVYGMLTSYGAMGLILGGIIPLIILIFFSVEMGKSGVGGQVIQKVVWVGFVIFLGYKLWNGFMGPDELIGMTELIIYGAIILISLIMIFASGLIMRIFFKQEINAVKAGVFREVEEEDVLRQGDKKRYEAMKARSLGK